MSFLGVSARALVFMALTWFAGSASAAIDPQTIRDLAFGESDAKIKAIGALTASGDPDALPLLQALLDGELQTVGAEQVLRVSGAGAEAPAVDLITGKALRELPESRDDIVINNRVRKILGTAIAALQLSAPDKAVRLAAAKELQNGADEDTLPAITNALARESDPEVKDLLTLTRAAIQLESKDKATRLAAIRALSESNNPGTKTLLLGVLERKGDSFAEPDPELRAEAQKSLHALEGRLATGEMIGRVFSGVSLGSILLLAALGLAITYGLMGVINMAHGELIMVGAYATYVVQNLFRQYAPGAFDLYLLCAVPVAFAAAGGVGMALERSVIRFLYGRPLETLLATWGISLILMQSVRTIFGAANVQVENPSWMSGGIAAVTGVVLPWNRIVIVGFAALVLLLMWLLLTRTRLGLFVRAVTQNRAMASCTGVPTRRVDTLAFGLGSGIAGLAGCALSQIGNVGPDLGQSYIVDSFMVVVLGGVGQLAGTVYAALGLGIVNKFLEAWSGAVLAKIAVLVFIIVFIQKRPQGLFALKGRMAET
ncbi:MAG TPA: urea ABC transporter permease subunit UrtB [Casimicrobiaceae bacterium]|nr:urea ABC transporter permease subunit UrtB [Casimicrobiaceae bacterium]